MALYSLAWGFAALRVNAGAYDLSTASPDDEQLCDCFDFDLVGGCGPESKGGKLCYTYRFKRVSDKEYCQRNADSVRLAIPARESDLKTCGLCRTDLDDLIAESAPTAYELSTDYDEDEQRYGLTFKFDDEDSGRLFSICFDGYGNKVGDSQKGELDISFDGGSRMARCELNNRFPQFCASTTTTIAPVQPDTTTSTSTSTSTWTTSAPTTPSPVTPAPVTPAPVTPAPVTPAPVTAEPTTSAPTTSAPTTSNPTSAEPTSDEPTTADPTTAAPTTAAPTTSEPTSASPTSAAPTTGTPTTAAPTTSEPTTSEPTTSEPTTSAPTTSAPTTADPTTAAPTSAAPTTAAPTTSEPTTAAPTTSAPTTSEPTTSEPTTAAPTTAAPTTLQPSAAPTYVACDTDDAFNIAFLLDESGSVDSSEWDVILQFVSRIATFDVAGPSYVSLFEYASLVAFTQFQDWTNLAAGEADILKALERNPYNTAGLTYTWDAVNRVLDEFYEYRQTCEDGCDTRKDLLFLLTDGTPTDQVCPDMIPRVNQSSVDIIIVGIGADAESWMDEVSCLDYRDAGADIFYVTEFDSDGFNAIEGMIRAKTCTGENPAGPSDRSGEPWVYEDGNIGLGPVPTASGDNDAPKDDTPSPIDSAAARAAWRARVRGEGKSNVGKYGDVDNYDKVYGKNLGHDDNPGVVPPAQQQPQYYGEYGYESAPKTVEPAAQGWPEMIEAHPTMFTLATLLVMGTVCAFCCLCAWFMHVYVGGAQYKPVKQVFVDEDAEQAPVPLRQF